MTDYAQEAADILGRWRRNPGAAPGAADVLVAGQLAALLAIEERFKELVDLLTMTSVNTH